MAIVEETILPQFSEKPSLKSLGSQITTKLIHKNFSLKRNGIKILIKKGNDIW
jgi:hypothetical protein